MFKRVDYVFLLLPEGYMEQRAIQSSEMIRLPGAFLEGLTSCR